MTPKFQEVKDILSSGGWNVLLEAKKEFDTKVEMKKSENRGLPMMRATTKMEVSAQELYRFMQCN